MENFTYEYVTGTVVSSQKLTQTHVYSQGGGQITAGRNLLGDPVLRGQIAGPTVTSYNTTVHEIFLEQESGQEISVSFPFDNIALRESHHITLIAVFRVGATHGYYAGLYNHNTRLGYRVLSNYDHRKLTFSQPLAEEKERAKEELQQRKGFLNKLVGAVQQKVREFESGWQAASPDALAAYQNRETNVALTPYELNQPLALELSHLLDEALQQLQS